jgi:hypothetical protein
VTAAAERLRAPAVQRCVIEGWLPEQTSNGQHGHWATRRGRLMRAQAKARTHALVAGWEPVAGRVRLEIVLVFPVRRQRDTDNLYARCKGVGDGLKGRFFRDDATAWLELVVRAEVRPGVKCTEITLAPATLKGGA